jgi:predicted PurR-regulated permease PerM
MPQRSRVIREQLDPGRRVDVPYGIRLAAAWTWRLAVIAVGIWGLLWLVAAFQVIVVPLLVATLVTALLLPAVDRLHRLGVPRGLAVAGTLLGVLALVVGLLTLVGTQIVTGFGDLQEQAAAGWREVERWLATGPLNLSGAQIEQYVSAARAQVSANSDQLVQGAMQFTSTAGHVITGFFLAVFAAIFFLHDGERIWRWLQRLLPAEARDRLDVAARRGWVTLTAYVRATVIVALVDGAGIGIGAAILGVPLAAPLGVLVFLGAFVPIVGALVTGAVAVLVALVAEGPVTALLMLAIVIAVQQAESHILQPLLLGRAVSVHPLGVVLAIAAGVLVAGVVGALFAVPLVAVLNTVTLSLTGARDEPELPDDSEDAPLAPDPVEDDGVRENPVPG